MHLRDLGWHMSSRALLSAWLTSVCLATCTVVSASFEEMLTESLSKSREELKMPGLRAAVRLPDGEIVKSAVGLADKEANIPLDNSIAMPGGSTGKTFVAALTMLLVEDGVISLDDPAAKYVGEHDWYRRIPNADVIKVSHLLSHSAGIGDYPGTGRYTMGMVWRVLRQGSAKFTPEELIGFAHRRKPYFLVGQGFRYSDVGYLILGRVIESATGERYYDLIQEKILDPHGLDEIVLQDRSVLEGIAPGYTVGARNIRKDGTMKIDPSSEWTGGGLATNPAMLVKFISALSHGDIVSQDSFAQMLKGEWHDPSTPGDFYGFGLFVYDNGLAYGHAGLWPGYRTQVLHYTNADTTIAVQTNRDGRIDLYPVIADIARLLEIPTR